jgi:hypothetical protein
METPTKAIDMDGDYIIARYKNSMDLMHFHRIIHRNNVIAVYYHFHGESQVHEAGLDQVFQVIGRAK